MTVLERVVKKGPEPGLCGNCQHARQIESDRGSVFIRCELSPLDPRFAKYPGLPVLLCSGYKRKEEDDEQRARDRARSRENDPGAHPPGRGG